MSARTRNPLHPDLFPRLAEFASGYLHQDFTLEHATPEDALRAFLADANDEERAGLHVELERFHEAAKAASWADAREAFEALGGAWRPRSRAALASLFEVSQQLSATRTRKTR